MKANTFMVIDDAEEIRDLLYFYLSNEYKDAEILLFSSSHQAWDLLNEKKIHSPENLKKIRGIICDLHMPDGNGDELYFKVRLKMGGIPFIFISGDDPEIVRKELFMEGQTEDNKCYIFAKPFTRKELYKIIEQLNN